MKFWSCRRVRTPLTYRNQRRCLTGNSLQSSEKYRHDGQPFTTSDHHGGCATAYRGAWWFAKCFYAHLNGEYFNRDDTYAYAHGIIWEGFRGHKVSLKKSMMMLRRVWDSFVDSEWDSGVFVDSKCVQICNKIKVWEWLGRVCANL